ncbi:hypothetical protein FBU30_004108 [Linnemannia zychae]|nr:hypothetical protein FBU30_004108 [Linnemannia zychae]
MDTLPTELLLAIINRLGLDQESIAVCNQLNKRWHALTRHILYRQPCLCRLKSLEAFIHTVDIESNQGRIEQSAERTVSNSNIHNHSENLRSGSISDDALRIPQSAHSSIATSSSSSSTITSNGKTLLVYPGQLVESVDLSMLPHRWETVHVGHIQGLVQGCLFLSALDLSDCNLLRDNAVQSIAEILGPRKLRSLILSGCTKITDIAILSICAHAVQLENLELAGCDRLTDISIIELGSAVILPRQIHSEESQHAEFTPQGISKTLRSLNLAHCTRITDTGIRGLRQGAAGLVSLNLEGCYGVLASDNELEDEWEDVDDLALDSDLEVMSY